MKRCSKCDFIYEDDQNLCDMDGAELVHEPTLYPVLVSRQTTSADIVVKRPWRSFVLTAAATVALGAVLLIGFYGFTARTPEPTTPASTSLPEESVTESVVEPVVDETPAPSHSPEASPAPVKNKRVPDAATKSALVRPATSTAKGSKSEPPAKAKQEEGSKVGSLLKKTGRVLKKPFKF